MSPDERMRGPAAAEEEKARRAEEEQRAAEAEARAADERARVAAQEEQERAAAAAKQRADEAAAAAARLAAEQEEAKAVDPLGPGIPVLHSEKLGVVAYGPDSKGRARLRWEDGSISEFVTATELRPPTEAQAAEAWIGDCWVLGRIAAG